MGTHIWHQWMAFSQTNFKLYGGVRPQLGQYRPLWPGAPLPPLAGDT